MPSWVVALGLLGCATLGSAASRDDTFIYAISGDIDSLDPHWHFDGISQEVQFQIYETLIQYKGKSTDQFEPLIASRVPSLANGLISKDGLRYTFPIRENAAFHDGTKLTPEDVRYSLLRFMLMDRASGPSFLLLEPLLGLPSVPVKAGKPDPEIYRRAARAVTVEERNVVLRLPKPYPPLLSILAAYAPVVSKAAVVARKGWDGASATWPKFFNPMKHEAALHESEAGTGPFKLERWDQQNKQLVLSRHEGYWRAPAKLKRLVFKSVSEPATRKLMLQAGDADQAMMERQYLPQVEGIPGVEVTDGLPFLETHNVFVMTFKISPAGNPYIGSGKLGDGIPPDFFSDIHVRRGLAHAFDYEAYRRDGYRGKARRARGPIPYGVPGHNAEQPVRDFDLAKATEELKKAWGGQAWEKGFRFALVFADGFADRQLACQILKKNVEALNPKFRIDIRPVLQSTWLAHYAARKIPMSNARWHLDYPDPDNPATAFLHSSGYYGSNSGYSNPKADRLVEQARRELDPGRRLMLYHQLQAIAHEDVPQIYTVDTSKFQVNRSWVQGWYYNPIMMYGYFYPVYKGG